MKQAISLAQTTFVQTSPNPKVACVIVRDHEVIGRGVHGESGFDHAEVIALEQAGELARGATAYVTLEPCGHVGKTEPCAQALLNAGIQRVVFAVNDPIHGGAHALQERGIEVTSGVCEDEAREVLASWLHNEICKTPFVTLKIAASLDGFIAALDGTSQWITSQASRHFVQQVRLEVDGIVTSTQTVEIDNPHFTIREFNVVTQPHVYVLGNRPIDHDRNIQGRYTAVQSRDPHDVLRQAEVDNKRHLLIEAGGQVAAAFLQANLVNRVIWISAPLILTEGVKALQGLQISSLTQAIRGTVVRQFTLEHDYVTVMHMNRCAH